MSRSPGPVTGLDGVDPSWSRRVTAPDGAGVTRTWHVLDNGAEPSAGTMLCVHGNPTWSYLWRRFLATAPPGWRVVAVDHLGMGWSERLPAIRRLAERIDDLDALTRALGIEGPVVPVAHDWGGPIALGSGARRHPERARRATCWPTPRCPPRLRTSTRTATAADPRLARSRPLPPPGLRSVPPPSSGPHGGTTPTAPSRRPSARPGPAVRRPQPPGSRWATSWPTFRCGAGPVQQGPPHPQWRKG